MLNPLSLEARVGIGPLRPRSRSKNTIFSELRKHYAGTTQSSTRTTRLLTFLLTLPAGSSGWATTFRVAKENQVPRLRYQRSGGHRGTSENEVRNIRGSSNWQDGGR